MRPALRLLAAVQKGTNYLEAGAPTGITGLHTSPAPRTTLLYLYNQTLEKLRELPESSVYRQSTEALTKHRLRIIEEAKPAGLAEWQARVKDTVDAYPQVYRRLASQHNRSAEDTNIAWKRQAQAITQFGDTGDEYDARPYKGAQPPEGLLYDEDIAGRRQQRKWQKAEKNAVPEIEAEPALTAEQIGEIEQKIGAGLIEEVIEVAEGELLVAQTVLENKAWEDLEEKPVEGQWTYFGRDAHASGTQAS